MRMVFFFMVPLLIALASCGSAKQDTSDSALPKQGVTAFESIQGTPFDIRVFVDPGEADSVPQFILVTALNDTAKTTTGVFVKVGEINGPSFSATEDSPHFVGRPPKF